MLDSVSNTSSVGVGPLPGAVQGSDLSDLVARNSTRFGVDPHSLAADIGDLPFDQRSRVVSQLSTTLSSTQHGELLGALDRQIVAAKPQTHYAAHVGNASAHKPAHTSAPLGISKLLGPDVVALASKSPSLMNDMAKLQKAGWHVQLGEVGHGTFANRASTPPAITIDRNEVGHPAALVQSLAHEVGHARYGYHIDSSSRPTYVRSSLADEGAATLSNIRAEREILQHGGTDIGIAGDVNNAKAYNAAYNHYIKTGNADQARNAIGTIYGRSEHTSNTHQAYAEYYGGFYDSTHKPK